jgi:4-hydroxy-4-methyl-2-oxoglutarate aldolase
MIDHNVERASRLDTASLSDAMDKLGVCGQCLGLLPLDHQFRLSGRAFTLQYAPHAPGGTVGDYVDDVPAGAVICIDNAGRPDATVWGDILTVVAHRRGIAGTVIDGACRDTQTARSVGYAIFSRSHSMRTGKDRVQLERTQQAVSLGGARVLPGDIIRGDADGTVAIPRDREEEILNTAEAIERAEQTIRDAVSGGLRLDEARRCNSYHALQTRAVP